MRRIAAVYLPIAILAAALVLGGLKLASEVFAQTEEPNYEDGWQVLSFTSIVFEDDLWEPGINSVNLSGTGFSFEMVGKVVGGCTLYSSRPVENNPASVKVFNGLVPLSISQDLTGLEGAYAADHTNVSLDIQFVIRFGIVDPYFAIIH